MYVNLQQDGKCSNLSSVALRNRPEMLTVYKMSVVLETISICMYVCMYVCIYVCACVCVHMCLYIYLFTYYVHIIQVD